MSHESYSLNLRTSIGSVSIVGGNCSHRTFPAFDPFCLFFAFTCLGVPAFVSGDVNLFCKFVFLAFGSKKQLLPAWHCEPRFM